MLKLKGITKDYVLGDDTVHALKGIDLEFRESEFVAVLGHSGCGKTTLLNIIGGLDQYTEGDLIINGRSTKDYGDRDWDTYRNHSIGFVFQSYNLIPHQTVLSNVELALTLSGVSKSERRERAVKVLEQVGLGDQLNKKPNQMSGGQMQRVAIARALVNDPDILLADEPTGALDSETSVQIMEILKEISKDKLIIMVTHNPELAETYASRIIRLKDGLITADSMPYSSEDGVATPPPQRKTVMSYLTALSLSLNNLMTKKGRTFLTSFAGSIGIIGIALILSISTGVNNYIDKVQEDTLSSYPISIQAETADMTELMTSLMGVHAQSGENAHDKDAVYGNTIMYDMMNTMTNAEIETNNLRDFKVFLDEQMAGDTPLSENVSNIQYTYDLPMNLYTKDVDGNIVKSDVMTLMSRMRAGIIGEDAEESVNASMNNMLSSSGMSGTSNQFVVWQEMLPGDNGLVSDLVQQQYDVLYGTWPQNYDETVLIVDENNEVSDMVLYALGLKSSSEMLSAMTNYMKGEQVDTTKMESWSYADVCQKTFSLILPADCWQEDPTTGEYKDISTDALGLKTLYGNGIQLKIVGVVRQNEDAVSGMMTGAIGYTNALTKYVVEQTADKELVKQQLADPEHDIFTGLPFKETNRALTAEEIKQAVIDYCAGIDSAKKAELYVNYMSVAPESYVDSMIDEQLDGVSREDIENTVVENYPEYADMLSAMDDDTLISYMREMMSQQISKAYSDNVKAQMSQLSTASLAEAFDQCYFTDEGYKLIYDNFMPETFSDSSFDKNLRDLGYVELDSPSGVNIYVATFAAKDAVADIIEDYNDSVDTEDQISYTDYVALIMSSVTTIIDVISYVLIAFVAISLIVSSIMIGIITYISVLERTKEIGILRAIGASKKDISRVFNAETVIVGLGAGLIGILATMLLCVPINAIVHHLTGIYSINAVLPPVAAVILVAISMLLTVVAGLIPSRFAANKDPVVALRTE
ncbi:MAG: ABC transporter ATP-binding protein/permease [Oscillospiraceae bacterium]|nr:ABC transporter ATP-binding protein/permease [Oscillospiraceae bacterium]